MAIRTYTGTWRRPYLADAKIELYILKVSKYERGSRLYIEGEEPEDEEKRILTGVMSWSIIEGGEEADAIERLTKLLDDAHEYLIINYIDGKSEIFRNSYVTMFIL